MVPVIDCAEIDESESAHHSSDISHWIICG